MMMKKMILTFAVVFTASLVNASLLYWQLDSTGDGTAAKITDGTNIITTYGLSVNSETGEVTYSPVEYLTSGVVYAIDTSDATTSAADSYFIEYYNYADSTYTATGNQSSAISASDVATYNQNITITAENMYEVNELAPIWHASGAVTPAPEPTSAILMMFGAAMLGLKRKNRSRA